MANDQSIRLLIAVSVVFSVTFLPLLTFRFCSWLTNSEEDLDSETTISKWFIGFFVLLCISFVLIVIVTLILRVKQWVLTGH